MIKKDEWTCYHLYSLGPHNPNLIELQKYNPAMITFAIPLMAVTPLPLFPAHFQSTLAIFLHQPKILLGSKLLLLCCSKRLLKFYKVILI